MRGVRQGLALGAALAAAACSLLTKLDDPRGAPGDAAVVDAAVADVSVAPTVCDASDACIADAPPPYFGATYVSQSFPLATTALTMTEGQTIPSFIELKNVGNDAWTPSTQLATTEPRDRASAFKDATWVAPNRLAAVVGTVPPGATYKFKFDLHAPQAAGTYFEHFGLVDGNVWFGDLGQGGPADDVIEVQIQVVPPVGAE